MRVYVTDDPPSYPHFTMLFQSLASMLVVIDGLRQFVPDIFFDTTGLAFTYPVVKLLTGATVLSYTHYPTISTDMLQRVREKRSTYNNDAFISNSTTISTLKLLYDRLSPLTSATTTHLASSTGWWVAAQTW